jgi:hypothetical protein
MSILRPRENGSCAAEPARPPGTMFPRIISLLTGRWRQLHTCSLGRRVASQNLVPIAGIHFDSVECLKVTGEISEIVPPHRVYICLRDLAGKGWMRLGKEAVQVLEPNQSLLLDDLGVDIRRPHRSDLSHQIVPDSFNRLHRVSPVDSEIGENRPYP